MTGRCKKCKNKDRLIKRHGGLYCYGCARLIPSIKPQKRIIKKTV